MKFYGPMGAAAFIGFATLLDMLKRKDSDNAVRNIYETYGVPALKDISESKSNIPTNSTMGLKLHAQKEIASKAARLLLTATGDHRPPRGGYRPGLMPYVRRMFGGGYSYRRRKVRGRKKFPYKRRLRRLVRRYTKRNWTKILKRFKKNLKSYKKKSSFQRKTLSFKPRSYPPSYTFYTPQY